MYKIHRGGGGGGGVIASARPRELHFTFLCNMGLPCKKVYKIET